MKKSWRNILIPPNKSIIDTMKVIDETTLQFAAVVDTDQRLLGVVTDGDIRRGILRGLPLDSQIQEVMNARPTHAEEGMPLFFYQKVMLHKKLKQLPIVNKNMQIKNILFSDGLGFKQKENSIILMAGGLGTRLRPLTNDLPKPMLKVGDTPILETIIDNFKSFGFKNFILSVNYKKEVIQEYFMDGAHIGVNITYIEETKRLGTAGALSLLKEPPKYPFFVMNGDLLTKINFEQLLDFHNETNSSATMSVREYEYQVPYGVIETDCHRLLSIEEKPIHKSFVNAGIYVLNPEVISQIPYNEYLDMPDLFKKLIKEKKEVSAFPLREYWMDIGRIGDYEKANGDINGGYYDK